MIKYLIFLFTMVCLPCYSMDCTGIDMMEMDMSEIQAKPKAELNQIVQCTLTEKISPLIKHYRYEELAMVLPTFLDVYQNVFDYGNGLTTLDGKYKTPEKLKHAVLAEQTLFGLASTALNLEDPGCGDDDYGVDWNSEIRNQIQTYQYIKQLTVMGQLNLARRIGLQTSNLCVRTINFDNAYAYRRYVCALVGVIQNMNVAARQYLAVSANSLIEKYGDTHPVGYLYNVYIRPNL